MAEANATKSSKEKGTEHGERRRAEVPRQFSSSGPYSDILALQRAAGNRAVSELLQIRMSGASQLQLSDSYPETTRPEISISQPGDFHEQEAERLSGSVLRTAEKHKGYSDHDEGAHLKSRLFANREAFTGANLRAVSPAGSISKEQAEVRSRLGTGQPLPHPAQAYFGRKFGRAFDQVRVHTDSRAAESAASLEARAYTVGSDIVFGAGEFAPETETGKQLLAHELTHVLQQGAAPSGRADGLSQTSAPANITHAAPGTVQRRSKSSSQVLGHEYVIGPYTYNAERYSFKGKFIISGEKNEVDKLLSHLKTKSLTVSQQHEWGAKGWTNSLSLYLAKADWELAEPLPGLFMTVYSKLLDTKVKEGDVDVDLLKVGLAVKGTVPPDIIGLNTETYKVSVRIEGSFELSIDPSDVKRLAEMAKLNKQLAANAKEAIDAEKRINALKKGNKRIVAGYKKLGSKTGAKKLRQTIKRLKVNQSAIRQLTKKLEASKKAAEALRETYQGLSKSLKTKAGRLVGQFIRKIGAKVLLKLIPILNVILLVWDVIQVSIAIFKLLTGEIKLGTDGGEGEEGTEEGTGEGGTVPAKEAGDGKKDVKGEGEGDSESKKTEDTGKETVGGADTTGTKEPDVAAVPGAIGGKDDPNADKKGPGSGSEKDTSDEKGLGGGKATKQQPLHPAAQQVFDVLVKKGVPVSPIDKEQLNDIVPKDMPPDKLKALLARLKTEKFPPGKTIELGKVAEIIDELGTPATDPKDKEEDKTKTTPEPEKQKPGQKGPDVKKEEGTSKEKTGKTKTKIPGKTASLPGKQKPGSKDKRLSGIELLDTIPKDGTPIVKVAWPPSGNGNVIDQTQGGPLVSNRIETGRVYLIEISFIYEDKIGSVTFRAVAVKKVVDEHGDYVLYVRNLDTWRVKGTDIYMAKDQVLEYSLQ